MKRVVLKMFSCMLMIIMILCSVAYAENAYNSLDKGAKGEEVIALQTRLAELGFYTISIDGDYGNGTSKAIMAFEEYNGLEPTGVATSELLEFMYSDEAQGIEIPDVEITDIGLKKSYGYYILRPTFKNNTGAVVDAITCQLKVYNSFGERVMRAPLTIDDIAVYAGNDDYNLQYSTKEVNGISIKANEKYSLTSKNEWDTYDFEQDSISIIYMAVTRYHTTDGNTIDIPENEQIWYGSNGEIKTYTFGNVNEENNNTSKQADTSSYVNLGANLRYINNFWAEVINMPFGGVYIDSLYTPSDLQTAGLKSGDILVKINDTWVYDQSSLNTATSLIEAGTETVFTYYRNGVECQASITVGYTPTENAVPSEASNGSEEDKGSGENESLLIPEFVSVKMSLQDDCVWIDYSIRNNNPDKEVDYSYRLLCFDSEGNVCSPEGSSVDDMLNSTMLYSWSAGSLQPGVVEDSFTSISLTDKEQTPAKVAIGISEYSSNGKGVVLSEDQIKFYCSDGSVIEPKDYSQTNYALTEEEYDEATLIKYGYTSYTITPYLSTCFNLPAGEYISDVTPNSISANAGFRVGDIIVSVNGSKTYLPNVISKSKTDYAQGNDVEFVVSRNNEEKVIVINNRPAENSDSKADEIMKYAEMLEKGLITQEEYDQLKSELING